MKAICAATVLYASTFERCEEHTQLDRLISRSPTSRSTQSMRVVSCGRLYTGGSSTPGQARNITLTDTWARRAVRYRDMVP